MNAPVAKQTDKTEAFLSELSALSAKYGIGLAGKPTMFLMEQEDFQRAYSSDAESNLFFE